MFEFIKIQYELGKLTEEQVRAFAPRRISEKEANEIISGQPLDDKI